MVIDFFYIFWVSTICQWLRYRVPSGKSLSGREDRQPWSRDEHMAGVQGEGEAVIYQENWQDNMTFFFFSPVSWFLSRTLEDEQDFCQKEKKRKAWTERGRCRSTQCVQKPLKDLREGYDMIIFVFWKENWGQYGGWLLRGDTRGVVLSFHFYFCMLSHM